MSDNSDDRFSLPPIEGVWEGAEPEPEEPDAPEEQRSIRLPLPPPGLFARLESPEDEADEDEADEEQTDDEADEDADVAVEEEPEPPAPYSYRDLLLNEADVEEADETDADLDQDVEEDDDEEPEDEEPEDRPTSLVGVADAVDVVEQLAAMPPPPRYAAAPEEEEAVLAARAALAADEEPVDEPDTEPEAEPLPDYALVEEESEAEAPADDGPAFVLPRYGAELADTPAEPEEEILPHFLLDEAAPLDVISAQDELREMARKNRRKADKGEHEKPSLARTLAEIPILLVVAAVIAFLVKTFIAQAYYIPSGSMLPQLQIDDRVVVSKLAYKFHDPRRGDIIVFDDPKTGDSVDTDNGRSGVSKVLRKVGEGVGVVQPSTDEFIKRVIALPGEEVSGHDGYVYVNNHKLIEPYLPEGLRTEDFAPQTVEKGKLWVMGDNRPGSADSRIFGQIDIDSIVGRAVIKVWPFAHISFL